MEQRSDNGFPEHGPDGETIVPVRPGFAKPAADTRRPRRSAGLRSVLVTLTSAALIAAAFAVFVWLPEWVAPPVTVEETAATDAEETPVEPDVPPLSEEELARLRSQTESLLSRLLRQQPRLMQRSPAQWAGDDWERYQSLSRAGDDAYLADAYQDAVPAYTEALELGETLLTRATEIINDSLEAGQQALARGEPEAARSEFETVLTIDPNHQDGARGLGRAERLPELLALVERGDELRDAGRLSDAADTYREALRVDATWGAARTALADVNARIERARFDALMSNAFSALAAENFAAAQRHFNDALAMSPDSREARDGLAQAEQGLELDQIALAEVRALAFERRELWAQAIEQYHAALATDPTLEFARTGLQRAQLRADLDVKIEYLLENPSLLLTDQVLADAHALLEEARTHDSPASRLEQQAEELERLVSVASTPIPVELVSDQQTEVTLYRVGALGTFDTKTVELRPGTYTAIGSRRGYRDVRETFTVLPGREPERIRIACVEPLELLGVR